MGSSTNEEDHNKTSSTTKTAALDDSTFPDSESTSVHISSSTMATAVASLNAFMTQHRFGGKPITSSLNTADPELASATVQHPDHVLKLRALSRIKRDGKLFERTEADMAESRAVAEYRESEAYKVQKLEFLEGEYKKARYAADRFRAVWGNGVHNTLFTSIRPEHLKQLEAKAQGIQNEILELSTTLQNNAS